MTLRADYARLRGPRIFQRMLLKDNFYGRQIMAGHFDSHLKILLPLSFAQSALKVKKIVKIVIRAFDFFEL